MFKILILFLISSFSYSKEIRRIITTMPSLTEMVDFLGRTSQIVGVTPYCTYPVGVKKIEKIGSALELNYEKIISLKPDIVLLPKTQDTKALLDLKKLQIKSFMIGYERLDEIIKSFYELDDLFGNKNSKKIKEFEKIFTQKESMKKKILIVISKEGVGNITAIRAAGHESIYDDLIKRLGYSNAISNEFSKYPMLNLEQIMSLKFDYILRIGTESDSKELNDWNNLFFKDKMKYVFKDYAVVTGPRLALLYKDLLEILND